MPDTLIIICAKYLIGLPIAVLAAYLVFASWAKKPRLLLLSLISMTLAYALARVASDFYEDPRPFVVGHFKPLIDHAADNGFPSDHMLLAATIAMVVFFFNKRMGIVLWIVAAIIGFSRVAAGIHHPLDIAGSAAIAVVSGTVAYYIVKALRNERPTHAPSDVQPS